MYFIASEYSVRNLSKWYVCSSIFLNRKIHFCTDVTFFLGYKFCVSESDNATPKCRAILKGNSQVTCVPVIDRWVIFLSLSTAFLSTNFWGSGHASPISSNIQWKMWHPLTSWNAEFVSMLKIYNPDGEKT